MEAGLAVAQRLAPAVAAPTAPETGGTLTVDLAAIAANWRALADRLLAAECAAVVKADAYGLGLQQVTTALAQAGCKTFFVADLAEARTVRSRAPEAAIYVLHGFSPDWGEGLLEINARPVINSTTELAEWDVFVAAHSWRGGAALQVDTGMRRLGISPDEAAALAPRAQTEHHGIALLMSHLVCARNSRPSAQCQADPSVSRIAYALSRRARLAGQLLGHFSRRFGTFRSGAARRRALRRQPDTRSVQSDAKRGRIERPHPAASQRRARRYRRL